MSGAGHSYAMQIASRNMSALAQRDYQNTGLGALNWLGELVTKITQDDAAYNALIAELKHIHTKYCKHLNSSYWYVKSIIQSV